MLRVCIALLQVPLLHVGGRLITSSLTCESEIHWYGCKGMGCLDNGPRHYRSSFVPWNRLYSIRMMFTA